MPAVLDKWLAYSIAYCAWADDTDTTLVFALHNYPEAATYDCTKRLALEIDIKMPSPSPKVTMAVPP